MRRETNSMQVKRFFKYFGIGVAILIGGVLVAGQIAHYSVPVVEPPGKIYCQRNREASVLYWSRK
jgi:hypothetical protein